MPAELDRKFGADFRHAETWEAPYSLGIVWISKEWTERIGITASKYSSLKVVVLGTRDRGYQIAVPTPVIFHLRNKTCTGKHW